MAPVRILILIVALLFIGMLATLTVLDIAKNGLNALNVVSVLIVGLFATGIVGALIQRPRQ
jgi:hypothetical protein